MNTKWILSYLVFFLFSSLSWSKTYYIPYTGSSEEPMTLLVNNNSQEMKIFWLKYRQPQSGELIETPLQLAPNRQAKLPLNQYSAPHTWAMVSIPNTESAITFKISTSYGIRPLLIHGANGYQISETLPINKIFLANSSSLENHVKIYNHKNQVIDQFSLPPHGSLFISPIISNNRPYRIEAEYRLLLSTYTQDSIGWKWNHPAIRKKLSPNKKLHYFLVGRRDGSQPANNFIIPIEDSNLIAKARYQINNPDDSNERIISAQIQIGHGNFNRSFGSLHQPVWSWHATKVTSFGDFASQKCDGSPTQVEIMVKEWVTGIKRICFWNFTVIKELRPEQI